MISPPKPASRIPAHPPVPWKFTGRDGKNRVAALLSVLTLTILKAALRIGVLGGFAFLIGRVTRQSRELRLLRGLLTIREIG